MRANSFRRGGFTPLKAGQTMLSERKSFLGELLYSAKNRNVRPLTGFTLIELLVVISIIAVLSLVTIFTLNPAELLRQSRDSDRISDMATLNSAVSMFEADQSSASLGSSGVVDVSLPDSSATTTAGTICSPFNYPSGGYVHCPAPSVYKTTGGSGWLPLNFSSISSGAPFGTLPVDPINNTSSDLYYSYGASGSSAFKVSSIPESQKYLSQAASFGKGSASYLLGGFPNTWVQVPGNSTFGTSNFWVMKYDAKCVQNGVPLGTVSAAYDSGYRTYYNSSYPCSGSSYAVASAPDGFPIAYISHTDAVTYCESIGAHLLTNDEYMTIVTNAANVGSNWSGGSSGSGYMYSGHNDNAPAYALPADTNDANGYSGETNTGGNQRRTLTLSNGQVVWDFAGNVWEHVQRSTSNSGDLTTAMALPVRSDGAATWDWGEYGGAGTVNNSKYISSWSSDVAQAKVGPPTSSWNSTNGVGQVYTYGTGANQGTTVFFRGAGWDYGSAAGPFALYLMWGAGYPDTYVGFRCVR